MGLLLSLPQFAYSQSLLDIAKTCIAPAQSMEKLSDNLESIGFEVTADSIDQASTAQHFAISTLAENVPLNSEAFDWPGQLNKDAQLLLRILKRGDTKFMEFRFFALKSDPKNTALLVQRWAIPDVKYENRCQFVGSGRIWTALDRNELLTNAQHSNSHNDGFQSAIIHWENPSEGNFEYVSVSFFDAELVEAIFANKSMPSLPIVSLLATATHFGKYPNSPEVKK